MEKKYELLKEDCILINDNPLYRIRALRDINNYRSYIHKGDLGGYIESESNLSHQGNCWVAGNAKVYDEARICGGALVKQNAEVFGCAFIEGGLIDGYAKIYGNAEVFTGDIQGFAQIYDDATINDGKIGGYAQVFGEASIFDYNTIISGYAKVFGKAKVWGNSQVSGYVRVFENAEVGERCKIWGYAQICGNTLLGDFVGQCNEIIDTPSLFE